MIIRPYGCSDCGQGQRNGLALVRSQEYHLVVEVVTKEFQRCGRTAMLVMEEIVRQQPYPCFRLSSVPPSLKKELRPGMLCLYNIDSHSLEFPTVGRVEPADKLLPYLDFVGYYSIDDFRDVVFSGVLPVNCPSCKGPVDDAGMISYELEEPGTAEVDSINGDAELYVCKFCKRPFALMPIP